MVTGKAFALIRDKRLQKNVSLYRLQQLTGINRSTLKRYEDLTIQNISFENLIKICKALDIDISELL